MAARVVEISNHGQAVAEVEQGWVIHQVWTQKRKTAGAAYYDIPAVRDSLTQQGA